MPQPSAMIRKVTNNLQNLNDDIFQERHVQCLMKAPPLANEEIFYFYSIIYICLRTHERTNMAQGHENIFGK